MLRALLLIVLAYVSATSSAAQSRGGPPNIVLILADDLGYGDLGSYGQKKIQTPRLDRMAEEGIRFTQFYAGNTVCAPSRWSLLTGTHMGHAYVRGNSAVWLRPEDRIIPEVLRNAGYATGAFGKWGLGDPGTTGTPDRKGFDEFLGYLNHGHAHRYYTDHLYEIVDGETVRRSVDTTVYTPDLFASAALDFIDRHRERPFFLYLPFTIPHAELLVPEEAMAPYMDESGRSLLRPEQPFPCCGVIGTYRAQPTPHAAFAGMVSRLDRDVGRILDRLEELGLRENTLVLFTSDNGPHIEGGAAPGFFDSNGPLRGLKRDLYEGGIRVPMIAWGGEVPAGRVSDHVWAMWDFLPTFAELAGVADVPATDGISMVDALADRPQRPHEYLYWEFWNRWGRTYDQVIRVGDWKLHRFRASYRSPWFELYDLKTDPAEYHDLSETHPDIVQRLDALIDSVRTEPELEQFRIPY